MSEFFFEKNIAKMSWLAGIKYPGLFVLRFYGPMNPIGHVERGQFT